MGGLSALSVVVPSEEWQGYEISLLLTAETGELVGGPGTNQLERERDMRERERERQTERKIRRKGQRALILNATSTKDQPITWIVLKIDERSHTQLQSKQATIFLSTQSTVPPPAPPPPPASPLEPLLPLPPTTSAEGCSPPSPDSLDSC